MSISKFIKSQHTAPFTELVVKIEFFFQVLDPVARKRRFIKNPCYLGSDSRAVSDKHIFIFFKKCPLFIPRSLKMKTITIPCKVPDNPKSY